MPVDKNKVLAGRDAVDAYRTAHVQLYLSAWTSDIPAKHTPLLNTMLNALKEQGFESLDEFFTASDELNAIELGFESKADFDANATQAQRDAFEGMWH